MKIKLNRKHILAIARELKETDRKNFDPDDVGEVFKMLQYWIKTAGTGQEKVQSVTELPDGYLCRVNEKFHDSIKNYIKHSTSRRLDDQLKDLKTRETIDKYDRLIKEAEEEKGRSE